MRDKYSHELIQKDIKFNNTPILTADLAFLCKKNNLNNYKIIFLNILIYLQLMYGQFFLTLQLMDIPNKPGNPNL